MRSNDERKRIQYRWGSRVIGQPWRVILETAGACGGVSQSARVAFNRWRAADAGRAHLGLLLTHHWYTGPESGGRKVDSLHLELFRLAPHQIRRPPLKPPPAADAMASVRARRAERAAAVTVDRRRRYHWQPVHGHAVTATTGRAQYRDVEKMRASWYGWKRHRQDSGVWDLAEAAAWRLRIDTTDPSRIVGIVTDIRLPPPAGAPPIAAEPGADRVLAAVADLPAGWPLAPDPPSDW